MSITATEFKKNLSKYLSMAETYAKLCNPNLDRVQMASSLFGVPDSVTLEEAKAERIERFTENPFVWMRKGLIKKEVQNLDR